MSKHPDVVVIGGGIIGLTCAYFLAKTGLEVEVLEQGEPGREASWAGAGILPPGNPDRAAIPIDRLRAIGSARFPSFSAELRELTGVDNGYWHCGGIEFLEPADEYVLPLWRAEGIAFERLTRTRLKEIEPAVGDVPGVPYLLTDCGQVRNPWHLRALIDACGRAGVRITPHAHVKQLQTDGRRLGSATLADGGSVTAGRFLITAGAWSEALLEQLGHRPRIHPVRGQIVLFRPSAPLISRVLMLGKSYLVPRADGRILVGSTEEPEAGFEKANTAGAIADLTAFAVRTVPALADTPVEKCWSGLRPGSADGLPYIGAVPGFDNAFVATGHFRAGVQLSIGTAQAVTELLTEQPPCVPLRAFALDREPGREAKPVFRS